MGVGPEVVAVFLVIISIVIVFLFCLRYGVFKLPVFAYILIIINAAIPVVMVSGLLPLDISLCLFGSTPKTSKGLKILLEVLYWVSFLLTWVVVPVIVSWLRYSHTVTVKQRIRLIIRENVIFYGVAILIIVIGLIIVFSTDSDFKFKDIPSLGISLTNAYGLLLLCFFDGYSFIELPRRIWRFSNARYKYLYHLISITYETAVCSQAVSDASSEVLLLSNVRRQIQGEMVQKFQDYGQPRIQQLDQANGELPIPQEYFISTQNNKKLKKLLQADWSQCTESQLEDLFSVVDDTIIRMKEGSDAIKYAGSQAERALYQYISMKKGETNIKSYLEKIFSILLMIINAICVWSEVCLMFNNKLSLFYLISHISMPATIAELFITAPIVGYLLFIGAWGLTNLRISSFYRFIPNGTNANTLNYWAILMARLGPTIGFHYLKQIGAEGSKLVEVMGKMEKVVFIGEQWNIFSPILLLIVIILVFFEIFTKISKFLCCKKQDYNIHTMDPNDLKQGELILRTLNKDVEAVIDENHVRVSMILTEAQNPDGIDDYGKNTILNDNYENQI